MLHVKAVRQTSPSIQNTVGNLAIKIYYLTVQIPDVQLTPGLGPVQRTVSWQELADIVGLFVCTQPQLLVGVLRGELFNWNRYVRRCHNT